MKSGIILGMNVMRSRQLTAVVFALLLAGSLFAGVASAQSQEEALSETIRAAILSDERSQAMTPAEIDAMVGALTRQAQSVGMTADDIVWRPTTEGTAQSGAPLCEGFLCALNNAFGFDGSDYTIPIWLGACALMLIFIIAGILEYRHLHLKKLRAQASSTVQ